MKVFAINSGSGRDEGTMARLLYPYLEGAKEAGAEVELYYGKDLVIYPCCGNLNCSVRTPGKCMARDDMMWLREKIGLADVLILASPLYFNGTIGPESATASMKSLLNRLAVMQRSSSKVRYEHAVHTTGKEMSLGKVVIVSGCGFLEIDDLDPILTHLKAFCHNEYPGFEGTIHGYQAAVLRGALAKCMSKDEVFQAALEAGRRLVLEYKVTSVCGRRKADPVTASTPLKMKEWENVILYQF